METELRLWLVRCPCGFTRSVWDLGGIKADLSSGEPTCNLRCPQCLEMTDHTVSRDADQPYVTPNSELISLSQQEIAALTPLAMQVADITRQMKAEIRQSDEEAKDVVERALQTIDSAIKNVWDRDRIEPS